LEGVGYDDGSGFVAGSGSEDVDPPMVEEEEEEEGSLPTAAACLLKVDDRASADGGVSTSIALGCGSGGGC
jgi:hypothetical protein